MSTMREGGKRSRDACESHFLRCCDGSSDKFYEVEAVGLTVQCKHGRSGSVGVTNVKEFVNEVERDKFITKILREKLKKGYVEEKDALSHSSEVEDTSSSKRIKLSTDEKVIDKMVGDRTSDIGQIDDILTPDYIGISLVLSKENMTKESENIEVTIALDSESEEPYAVSLIMPATSAGGKAKFYIIQLLHVRQNERKEKFYLFSRWGCIGEKGNSELSSAFESLSVGVECFEHRFRIKTANLWKNRVDFVPQRCHYHLKPSDGCSVTANPSAAFLPQNHESNPVVRNVYLECREGNSDKFYEMKMKKDNSVTIRYGRRSTDGVTSEKKFASAEEAESFVDKTTVAKKRKGYNDSSVSDDAFDHHDERDAIDDGVKESSGDQLTDLENGLKVFVQGSSKLPYTLKKFNGGYSCTCRGWVGQIRIRGIQAASCKHLKLVRGEDAELLRCQSNAGILSNPSSKANKNTSIISRISLAQKWKPSIDPTGYVMSEKLDGMRAYWCGEKLWTRSGLPIATPQWFVDGFPQHMELDGELFLGRKMFDECMSITRRTDASEDWKRIKYVVFDAPRISGGILKRLEVASQALNICGNEFIILHEHVVCQGIDHLLDQLASTEQEGGEGMMLRNATASHRGGRSVDLLKVKSFHDDEALVVNYEEGKGKYTGMVGSLVCRNRAGAAFKVGSGLVDSQRSYQSKTLPPIGSIITFQYFELTKDGIPRFPTFLRERSDVDKAEFN